MTIRESIVRLSRVSCNIVNLSSGCDDSYNYVLILNGQFQNACCIKLRKPPGGGGGQPIFGSEGQRRFPVSLCCNKTVAANNSHVCQYRLHECVFRVLVEGSRRGIRATNASSSQEII